MTVIAISGCDGLFVLLRQQPSQVSLRCKQGCSGDMSATVEFKFQFVSLIERIIKDKEGFSLSYSDNIFLSYHCLF